MTAEEKCEVTFSAIQEVTEEGVVTADGQLHRLDILICATGFDVSFRPRFPIVGEDKLDLRDAWKDQPYTYLSATIPQFPNYFSKCHGHDMFPFSLIQSAHVSIVAAVYCLFVCF